MTNKELLKQIAEQQFETASILSNFMNSTKDYISKQNSFNAKISGYLENNDKTNQVGVVQKQQELENRVSSLETNKKVMIGIATIFISITTWFSGIFK
jgi:hypothetical protein